MNQSSTTHLGAVLAFAALLVGWGIVTASAGFGSVAVTAAYYIVLIVLSLDLVDYLARLYAVHLSARPGSAYQPDDAGGLNPAQKHLHVRPYALVVSVYNVECQLNRFLRAMEPFRDRLWIVDDGSTDGTVPMLQRAGFRCLPGHVNRKKPAAIKRLLSSLPAEIETVVILDPDIRPLGWSGLGDGTLDSVVFDLQRSGAAGATPLIKVAGGSVLASFQQLEYYIAVAVGRRSLGDFAVSSGVAVYQREALEWALERHSLSVYAEDLELSMLLLGAGRSIYYEGRLALETGGQETLAALFSQRVGWAYGLLRVFASRFSDFVRAAGRGPYAAYQFLVYFGVISIVLQPLRLAAAAALLSSLLAGVCGLLSVDGPVDPYLAPPLLFVIVYLHYLLLGAIALVTAVPTGRRLELAGVVPLYIFYVVALTVPTTVGYLNWFLIRTIGRRLYHDHYQEERSLRDEVRGEALEESG